jgi:hypothetical protein
MLAIETHYCRLWGIDACNHTSMLLQWRARTIMLSFQFRDLTNAGLANTAGRYKCCVESQEEFLMMMSTFQLYQSRLRR